MSFLSRRNFITKLSALLPLSLLSPLYAFGKIKPNKKNYLIVFEFNFHHPMSEEEYLRAKKISENAEGFDKIYNDFISTGRLIKSFSSFRGTKNIWVALFKNKNEYRNWCLESAGVKIHNPIFREKYCRSVTAYEVEIPSHLSAMDIPVIMELYKDDLASIPQLSNHLA